jgi:uncharacterized membrane protein YbhN (UPF0104 family)/tRNA A-37 threonylcarbamoyl transferase component Bud32
MLTHGDDRRAGPDGPPAQASVPGTRQWHVVSRITGSWRPRLFAPRGERWRHGSDLILLALSLAALFGLALAASPASGIDAATSSWVSFVPTAASVLFGVALVVLWCWAAVLVVATTFRRPSLLLDFALGLVVVTVMMVLAGRVATGEWPDASELWHLGTDGSWVPPLRAALPAVVVMVASPHLVLPARRVGRWAVTVAIVALVLSRLEMPTAAAAGLAAALGAAAVVHLAVGSTRGRPTLDDVAAALDQLGVDVTRVGELDRQVAGAFRVVADADDGRRLSVEIHGRDAHDTQLLMSVGRAVWYREPSATVALGRLRQVEHEALVTMLAANTGGGAAQVVAVGETPRDDAVLVTSVEGEVLPESGGPWDAAVAGSAWDALGRLHAARITHGQIDRSVLVLHDGAVGLVGFGAAAIAGSEHRDRVDEVQLLVTTARAVGVDTSVDVAVAHLGVDGVTALLPFVQVAALTPAIRKEVKAEGFDVDALRTALAGAVSVEPPELERLRRVTVGTVLQAVLLVVAFGALASAAGGLDVSELVDALEGAVWALVVVGFLVAQLPRVAQSLSTMGASPVPLPLGPVYALQLAMSYIGLAVPSSAGRVALSVRFFQRQGLNTGAALTVGAIDGLFGFVVQATILILVFLTAGSLDLDLQLGSGNPSDLARLLVIFVVFGALLGLVLLLIPARRRRLFGWLRGLLSEAWNSIKGLRSPRRLGELIGGNLLSDILFAAALGVFCVALGQPVGLAELLVINIAVSLLAGLLPIPGGIGVTEGGLTYGLVRAGVPQETAFAIVMLYRLSTFYIPPIWGFFALRWLERNRHI